MRLTDAVKLLPGLGRRPTKASTPNTKARRPRWRVIEILGPTGIRTRHVVGEDEAGHGKVSGPIERFDPLTQVVTTRSQRTRYVLVGQPGMGGRSGRYTMMNWLTVNQVRHWEEVTSQALAGR